MSDLPKHTICIKPLNDTIEVESGITLLDAIRNTNISISADCNGRSKCGKCKVKILNQSQLSPTPAELLLLTEYEVENGFHLACEVRVDRDFDIQLPDVKELANKNRMAAIQNVDIKIDSHLKKEYVSLTKPDLDNQVDDLLNLELGLGLEAGKLRIPLSILQGLPSILRKNNYKVTVAISGDLVINIEPGDTTLRSFGIAFDLGTTTIVGTLINLRTGQDVAVGVRSNPQHVYGADVISRLEVSVNEPGGLNKLQKMVIATINEIIDELTRSAEVHFREIYEIVIAGNPIMNHIFLDVNPRYLGEAPFIPTFRECPSYSAEELNLSLLPKVPVFFLPNISAYVGGDITGFILAYNLHERSETCLGIDIGTNGEIVLYHAGNVLTCSAAAGPAFEGGHINCGMRATEGAIEKVVLDDDQIYLQVIEDAEPRGICGSGLIDVIAEMLKMGIINQNGRLKNRDEIDNLWYRERIIEHEKGNRFILVSADDMQAHEPLVVTQKDIRQFQLAKAAIAAGIKILFHEMAIDITDLNNIYIAGAFGAYINKYNAQRIGLLPSIDPNQIQFVGNAASAGAKKYLLSNDARHNARQIVQRVKYIELSRRKDFQDEYTEAMFFQASDLTEEKQ
ncbi:DUF4445 domain-containing protein [candidate division KSB1 bacterium]|nr:DUF4445 domain-containing protein [candidate division KSB1 bacterium]